MSENLTENWTEERLEALSIVELKSLAQGIRLEFPFPRSQPVSDLLLRIAQAREAKLKKSPPSR